MSDPAEQEEASLLWQELLQAKPTAQSSVFSAIRGLKKQMRHDRISHLRSIDLDARFVSLTHRRLGSPPTFANLRCGAWYVPPRICDGTCYFKSTDGHTGNWGFSLSRLNVQVALAAATSGRVLVVDSTRSGKRYPDALSKTLPIWCAVINRALAAELPPDAAWDVALHMPPWVPPSEAAQVEARLAGWVASLRRPALQPLLEQLRQATRAHMRMCTQRVVRTRACAGCTGGGGGPMYMCMHAGAARASVPLLGVPRARELPRASRGASQHAGGHVPQRGRAVCLARLGC